ncbi:MAG: hypothetical protein ACREU5_06965 [Burkholderiales bacterium]
MRAFLFAQMRKDLRMARWCFGNGMPDLAIDWLLICAETRERARALRVL